jgi:hypothetical protein
MTLTTEYRHLSISNKKKCTEILNKSVLTDDDIIDFLISLHLTLEVNLNALFRQLSHKQLVLLSRADIKMIEMIEKIDKIEMIPKTTLFIYTSNFNFDNKLNEVGEHHKIIGKLINFCEIRNKLIHGHSILTITKDEKNSNSYLKKKLNETTLKDQIDTFITIIKGFRFFLDCMESSLSPNGKESYKEEYLSDSFLTDTTFFKKMNAKKINFSD